MAFNGDKSGKIDELGDDNFMDWKRQMKSLLIVKDLWAAISTEQPEALGARPVVAASATGDELTRQQGRLDAFLLRENEFNRWNQMSDKALAHITMNVSRMNRNLISNSNTGREAWDTLAEHHQQQAVGTRIRIQVKLGQTFIGLNESMRAHLNNIWEMLNKIEDAGGQIDDAFRVATMLASVRPTYPTIATVVGGKPQNELTPVAVKASLIEEYESIMQARQPQAAATSSRAEAGLGAQQYRPWQNRQRGSRDMSSVMCNYCKTFGHIKKNCPLLMTSDVDLREVINELKMKKNKANAAGSGQDYTDCVVNFSSSLDSWVIDSGATSHMSPNKSLFSSLDQRHCSDVIVANGKRVKAAGIGYVKLSKTQRDGSQTSMKLDNALWVPELRTNLLSVPQLAKDGNTITFDASGVYMNNKKIASMTNNQYKFDVQAFSATRSNINQNFDDDGKLCIHEWHRRMSHRNIFDIKFMKTLGLPVKSCNCSDDCEHCLAGKTPKLKFGKGSEFEESLDGIVSDVCGPMQVESLGRKRYFVTFIDAYSRYCEVHFIREKSEVPECAIQFIKRMQNLLGKTPKIFRSDRGTEYMNQRLQTFLADEGIWFECTVGFCPEQNGMAEKKNDTLMNAARTMLIESNLPKNHWAEAVSLANHTTNRIISRGKDKSPYELMFNKKPKWDEFRQFGCEVYVKVPDVKRRKLDPKAIKMKFVGFDLRSKGYRVSNGSKVTVSREVHFPSNNTQKFTRGLDDDDDNDDEVKENPTNEQQSAQQQQEEEIIDISDDSDLLDDNDDFQSAEESDGTLDESDGTLDGSGGTEQEPRVEEESPPIVPAVRRSARPKAQLPQKYRFGGCIVERDDDVFSDDEVLHAETDKDPRTFKQAIKSENAVEWQKAMKDEINAIERNQTWELVDVPKNKNIVGSKWVYKKKLDNGNEKFKARLVAQGFSQKFGDDYDEVFAPVGHTTTLRILGSVAGSNKWIVKHYDVANAFLNGNLSEEIFMKPPPGQETNGKVYRLRKSLYGLKQAAHVWNKTLHESLVKNGCIRNKSDSCLYSYTSGGDVVYLLIHVDDILAATSRAEVLNRLMKKIGEDFEIKDLGIVKNYLGIEFERNGHFKISQQTYINKIVEAAGLGEAKNSKFPLDTGYYKQTSNELPSNDEYRRLIGMLLYLSTNTRPDIAASVGILSKRIMQPREHDLNEVKRIIRYLKGTSHVKLQLSFDSPSLKMMSYSDADWAEDSTDRKSNTGAICQLNGGTVAWISRKQGLVAQ
jgi:transposase InsO family protein